MYWASFNVLVGCLYISFEEMSFLSPLSISVFVCFSVIELGEFLIFPNIPYPIYNLQIYVLILWIFFTLVVMSFAQKFLILMKFSVPNFSLVTCAFGVIPKKSLPNTISWRHSGHLWGDPCTKELTSPANSPWGMEPAKTPRVGLKSAQLLAE